MDKQAVMLDRTLSAHVFAPTVVIVLREGEFE